MLGLKPLNSAPLNAASNDAITGLIYISAPDAFGIRLSELANDIEGQFAIISSDSCTIVLAEVVNQVDRIPIQAADAVAVQVIEFAFSGALCVWTITIDGTDVYDQVLIDTVSIDQTIGARAEASFDLFNPSVLPIVGDPVTITYQGDRLFGGTVDNVQQDNDYPQTFRVYKVECADWMQMVERRIVDVTYTSKTPDFIINDLHTNYMSLEGLLLGTINATGPTLTLVDADNIRLSELLLDVAKSVGFAVWYDSDKKLQFQKLLTVNAPFMLTDAMLTKAQVTYDRTRYRNIQYVKVTGTGGNVQSISRTNTTEVTNRAAIEGGTGKYENYASIEHPTSDVTGDLQLLGHYYAFIALNINSQISKRLTGQTWTWGLRPGHVASVNLPNYNLAGQWVIERVHWSSQGACNLITDFDARLTSLYQIDREFYLRIAEAGRAVISSSAVTGGNTVTFTTSQSWVVPNANGDGSDVVLQLECYGTGGGSAGNCRNPCFGGNTPWGGPGGAGGKAISLKTYPVGTTLVITIQSPGTAGVGAEIGGCSFPATDGGTGGVIKIEKDAAVVTQADSGAGGKVSVSTCGDGGLPFNPGCVGTNVGDAGADGAGTGDAVTVGGGSAGGTTNGGFSASGNAGVAGQVIIRY